MSEAFTFMDCGTESELRIVFEAIRISVILSVFTLQLIVIHAFTSATQDWVERMMWRSRETLTDLYNWLWSEKLWCETLTDLYNWLWSEKLWCERVWWTRVVGHHHYHSRQYVVPSPCEKSLKMISKNTKSTNRELISAQKTPYEHNNKVPSRLRYLTWHASKYKAQKLQQMYPSM